MLHGAGWGTAGFHSDSSFQGIKVNPNGGLEVERDGRRLEEASGGVMIVGNLATHRLDLVVALRQQDL